IYMEVTRVLLQGPSPNLSRWPGRTTDKESASIHHQYFSNYDQDRPNRDECDPNGVYLLCTDFYAASRLARQTRRLPGYENRLPSFRHNPNRSGPTISLQDAA